MSTPNASGSIALIRQHAANLGQSWRAATFKALVLHSADEAGVNPGPDYSFGWGLLNTATAAQILTAQNQSAIHIEEATLADGASLVVTLWSDGSAPLKVTLVWADPEGLAAAGTMLDPPDLRLINDLDMIIDGPAMSSFSPWVLDPSSPSAAATMGDNDRDNVEQIVIDTPVAGAYQLTIDHEGLITAGPQAFSLIVTGNFDANVFSDGFELGTTAAWSLAVP
jgi:hypothetical protein